MIKFNIHIRPYVLVWFMIFIIFLIIATSIFFSARRNNYLEQTYSYTMIASVSIISDGEITEYNKFYRNMNRRHCLRLSDHYSGMGGDISNIHGTGLCLREPNEVAYLEQFIETQ